MHLHHQIALTFLQGIGKRRMRTILSHTDSVEAFFSEKKYNLMKIPGIGKNIIEQMNRNEALKLAEPYLATFEKDENRPLFFQDPTFPQRLNRCDDGPLMLYSKGNMSMNIPKVVAIVGTRNASDYGKRICTQLIESFRDQNILVVSGLAYGIDVFVHQLCVKNNIQTVGVLGHGLDRIYPAIHRKTAIQMMENGGLLTEFLPGTELDRMNFPMRNRIVAGLCDATIVIESGIKGGSLITAELANDYDRDVFAFPGDVYNEFSKGCNWLIQQNKAHLINSSDDFMKMMNWNEAEKPKKKQASLFDHVFSIEEQKIVDYLIEKKEASVDLIALKSGMDTRTVNTHLLNLEFQSIVKSLPGYRYTLIL